MTSAEVVGQWFFPLVELLLATVAVFGPVVQSSEECGVLRNERNPPWNVGVYKENKGDDLELVCLGTAIERNIIVTAAHCLCDQSGKLKNEEFYVSLRKLDKHVKNKRNLHKIEKPNISIYSGFRSDIKQGNVAILRLGTSIKDEGFSPICIDWNNEKPLLLDGERLRHPTWHSGNILMADVFYVDYEQCHYLASPSLRAMLTSDKICAKSLKDFTGDVDVGSGLMYLNLPDKRWYMRGVVCVHDPEKSSFVAYSNIVLFMNWLSSVALQP